MRFILLRPLSSRLQGFGKGERATLEPVADKSMFASVSISELMNSFWLRELQAIFVYGCTDPVAEKRAVFVVRSISNFQ